MEKPFRPIPLDTLARWIFQDLESRNTVLGIPKQNIEVPGARLASQRFGRTLAAPLGVAAGPHTQLAQNIVSAWLCGARFIELKTVQILDEIQVSRPCIDSEDATFNCEWSQELKLEQSFDEYLKAWVLIHALAHKLGMPGPGMLFNMSVGYNLEGIQSERVQAFIKHVRDASDALPAAVDAVARYYPAVRDIDIPADMTHHVTLSTMHGCPPEEIERIARFMLLELGLHTWVKLNPTLLGPERLRPILNDKLGHAIEVPDLAFEHDPKFDDAMKMVRNLAEAARGTQASFGLKLSNTLEVVNGRSVFPANEKMMYMSGRALHPLTLTLAHLVTEAQDGQVPISFCGGADALNFAELVADGLSPITVCTDLLKPGGYARLQQYLVNLEKAMDAVGAGSLEEYVQKSGDPRERLAQHAARVVGEPRFAARERPMATKGSRPLGYFDCIAAPCQEACPSSQNIPDYMFHVANGQADEALEVILRTNAMPAATGSVCDHPCIQRCVRNHYDAPLAIREIKRFAVENGKEPEVQPAARREQRIAVVGAGPAGLSAAYYLAREGFQVTVYESRTDLGGMVASVIPAYRLTATTLEADVERVRKLGVEFKLGVHVGKDVTLEKLRQDYDYVFLGVGAAAGKKLGIPGEEAKGVLDALTFLELARSPNKPDLGQRVLVIGGGNSAMDAARTARRLVKDGSVDLVYRRTRAQMPADAEEVIACVEEGIGLKDLLAPLRVVVEDGKATGLVCGVMKLGEPDSSGRPRPVPTGEEVTLPCDTLVPAISQEPVLDFLEGAEIERNRDGTLKVDPATGETSVKGLFAGGDLVRGPASVIKAIADGRHFAEEIGRRHGVELPPEPALAKNKTVEELLEKKARKSLPQTVPVLPVDQRTGFEEVLGSFSPEAAAAEASRCLDCDELCSLCVTVCPNRANHAFYSRPLKLELPVLVKRGDQLVAEGSTPFAVEQAVQIFNLADSCNQCGNCVTFCPSAGRPWHDKPRFWLDTEGFETAEGDAFRFVRENGTLRLEAKIGGERHQLERNGEKAIYRGPRVTAQLQPGTWKVVEVQPGAGLAEGEKVELGACANLIALLDAEKAVDW
jgi:putative selenate reductase